MDVDKRVNYIQCLLRGSGLKKYKVVLTECKESAKKLAGDQFNLLKTKDVTMEQFWTRDKTDGIGDDVNAYLVVENGINF